MQKKNLIKCEMATSRAYDAAEILFFGNKQTYILREISENKKTTVEKEKKTNFPRALPFFFYSSPTNWF